MAKVSILETRPKKFKIFAWLIQLVEGTEHTHVAISWKDYEKDIRYVVEARGGGIRIITNTAFKRDNYIVDMYKMEVEDDRLVEIERFVWKVIAHDYGYKQIIGLAYMRFMNVIYTLCEVYKRPVNPFKDGEFSQVCIELALRIVEIGKRIKMTGIEDYGLREGSFIFFSRLEKESQEKVDRINGVSSE